MKWFKRLWKRLTGCGYPCGGNIYHIDCKKHSREAQKWMDNYRKTILPREE